MVSATFCDSEHEEIQQIMLLKLGKEKTVWLYTSKIILLSIWNFGLSILALIYPLYKYTLDHIFLTKPPKLNDIILVFFVIFLFGFLGCILGLLLNNSIIQHRRLQICLLIFCSLIAVIGGRISDQVEILKYIIWIIPPLGTMSKWAKHTSNFTWETMKALLLCCGYCVIYIAIYLLIMVKPSRRKMYKYR